MRKIVKMYADPVLDHAAEELKKYLRMMMPDEGEIAIVLDPEATDGYRLGLLSHFGLPFEGEDAALDDVIHVDADREGGILAGSNPRSVLFSVYRFLRESGCRWLYPGVDGDFVPVKEPDTVNYHKMAAYRFRGFCNEGSESQTCMLECADYYAKLEMNVYMLEWFIPVGYYNRYYSHLHNTANRIPEPLTDEQILQWKRMCECEIAKRGLMFHDVGHGWTALPFGFPANNSADNNFDLSGYSEEEKSVLAMVGGKREFFRRAPIFTNLCLSQTRVREAMVRVICDYAEKATNVDYLHVWLSDGAQNHCECEDCQKMRPSDWYVLLLNELDEELTRRGLRTRIVFIAYLDTMFAPEQHVLKNPERFSLLYAPIGRRYTASVNGKSVIPEPDPYVRNNWTKPETVEASLAHLKAWQKSWKGPVFSYEYHFWRHQYNDVGGLELAKRLYEDVRGLREVGIQGYVEDGSQRSFFPNGLPVYVYAAALMDPDQSFESIVEDYFSHAYGEDWREAHSILNRLGAAFDFAYMEGQKSLDKTVSKYYDPNRVPVLQSVRELCAEERALVKEHLNMPRRPQTVSWRLLDYHAEYCEDMAEMMIAKASGYNRKAVELQKRFCDTFGRHEYAIERYYDHSLACRARELIVSKPTKFVLE